jgi:hypothetical protein
MARVGLPPLAAEPRMVVAQGRVYYMDVIEHPDHMPSDLPDDAFPEGSPLDEIVGVRPEEMDEEGEEDAFLE